MQTQHRDNLVEDQLDQVKALLLEQFHSTDPQIASVLKTLSEQQGKMIRPAMVLLCGNLFGSIRPDHIEFAVMVELIHMASLLHDDVIDQAQLRRGRPSANAQWSNTTAILLGDFLLSRAFMLAASSRCDRAATLLGRTAQVLCVGELKQNLFKGHLDLDEDDYLRMIEAKTAALFRCSCQLAAMASGASEQQQEVIGEFGRRIGLAFQIADDLRDILSSETQEGKTLGTDLLQEKFTLPVIHWVNQDNELKQSRIRQITTAETPEQVIEQMQLSGSVDYAMEYARSQVRQAHEQLASFDQAPAKEALFAFSDTILADIA
ncbi:MAG: polyprenyl synthetase family protein [Planctomycetota bacterium]|jgi:octaprenyl-diphosphate synthase